MPDERPPEKLPPKSPARRQSLDGIFRPSDWSASSLPKQAASASTKPPAPAAKLAPRKIVPKPDIIAKSARSKVASTSKSPVATSTPHVPSIPKTKSPAHAPVKVAPPKKSKKKLLLIAAVAAALLVLLLGGRYVFAVYLPNTPGNVYKSGLKNSADANDKLIAYSNAQQQTEYKSLSVGSEFWVKTPKVSTDTTTDGSFAKSSGQFQVAGSSKGNTAKATFRIITKQGNTSPDLYAELSGVNKNLDIAGANTSDAKQGQWISVDHTLFDAYKGNLQPFRINPIGTYIVLTGKVPNPVQEQAAFAKVQVVNKQYLFSADPSKAVLTKGQFLGKDSIQGRTQYHYIVGYDKAHMQAYIAALGQALDDNQLNDWSKQASNGKNLSEAMDLESLSSQIANAPPDHTFDVWIDAQEKLVGKIAFTDPHGKSSMFTISNNAETGPANFTIEHTEKNNSGYPKSAKLTIDINSSINSLGFTLDLKNKTAAGSTWITGSVSFKPDYAILNVTVPKGAKPITDTMSPANQGGEASGASSSASSSPDVTLLF